MLTRSAAPQEHLEGYHFRAPPHRKETSSSLRWDACYKMHHLLPPPTVRNRNSLPNFPRARDRRLGYLQFENNHIAASLDSLQRALDGILRYPGVCRYSCW